MYPMTESEMTDAAIALAIALSDVANWTSYGYGVIGADVDGRDLIVAVQEDGSITVCRWADGNEYVEGTVDVGRYDVDAVRATIRQVI